MTIVVGFSEFHDSVMRRYPMFFETIPALQEALNNLTGEGYKDISSEHHLILNLGILAGVTMMELILLAVNGFGTGGYKGQRDPA